MRTKITFLTSLVVFSILLSACAGIAKAQSATPTAEAAETQTVEEENKEDTSNQTPRTLNVNGSGLVYLTPDIAYVNIGVHTEGKAAAEAVSQNNTSAQGVIDALKEMGVEDKDIQTTNFSIYPQQQYDTNGKPTGEIVYVVDNTVMVTVRKIDQVGEMLDAVVKAGANTINGIQFDVADKSAALAEARKAAVADARSKAEQLAAAAGVALGAVQTISEYSSGGPGPVFYGKGSTMAADAAAAPIQTGQMTLTLDVSIVYEIK